ncbi:MAG TPA: hypothetical protein VK841_07385 [Polyangiaceae bacterium]|jgi:hypothetical protein|nr:hypothetical protein [Polyangiaceae bacterium]
MPDEKGRKTAEEIRLDQQKRGETEAQERVRAQEREQAERKRREEEAVQGAVKTVSDSWYAWVEQAVAQGSDVKFCVVAKVINPGRTPPEVLGAVVSEAAKNGFRFEIAHQLSESAADTLAHQRVPLGLGHVAGQRSDAEPRFVYDNKSKGWSPGKVPQFGTSGTVASLVVRW